mgnify:CR=1 FL=1
MVGSSPTLLESSGSESELPTSCINPLSLPEIASLDYDSLIDKASLFTNEDEPSIINDIVTENSKGSVFIPLSDIKEEANLITSPELKLKIENTTGDEMFIEMISVEVVITSEDASLYEACEIKPDMNSVCSDTDIDERNIDQGYESIDSPNSDVDHSFCELFPDLAYQYVDSEMCC